MRAASEMQNNATVFQPDQIKVSPFLLLWPKHFLK